MEGYGDVIYFEPRLTMYQKIMKMLTDTDIFSAGFIKRSIPGKEVNNGKGLQETSGHDSKVHEQRIEKKSQEQTAKSQDAQALVKKGRVTNG